MKRYLIAVVLSAVLAIGLLVYGAAVAVPVLAQGCGAACGGSGSSGEPHTPVCRTVCTTNQYGTTTCTTSCM